MHLKTVLTPEFQDSAETSFVDLLNNIYTNTPGILCAISHIIATVFLEKRASVFCKVEICNRYSSFEEKTRHIFGNATCIVD